ncbi:MAG TPA: flagellar hook-associated protein 3 [Phycisphaerales bacterium]|nr:flagellar hook-associated protein 3 [Phycisphaerales bacterium]
MGGTLNSIYSNVSFALQLHTKSMMRLQEQASTGARINRPSDDPSAAYRILGLESQQRALAKYTAKIAETTDTLEIGLNVMQNMSQVLADERVRLSQIISGTYDQTGRERVAEAVNDALEQIVSFANARHMDQYLFGGGGTSSAPFAVQRENGRIIGVTYQGAVDGRMIEVAPGVDAGAFYVGDDLFRVQNRGQSCVYGETGATVGSGTSSVTGTVWLTVADANADGTFELSIDDGRTWVNADGTANQAVVDSRTGKVLFVDTTGITQTGVDMVSFEGTHDVFETLINIRDLLFNDRNLSDGRIDELRNVSMGALDEVRNLLVEKTTSVGSKVGFLDRLREMLEDIQYNTEDEASGLRDADITQVAIDLSRRQVLYEMSLAVAGKLISISLLDFI